MIESSGRQRARDIFAAALDAVRPEPVVVAALGDLRAELASARRILVVGGGKAGAGMVAGLESALGEQLERVEGIVNVPNDLVRPSKAVRLHPSRPIGVNEPTAAAVAGAAEMLALAAAAGADDIVIALLSGGGSALLPAPAPNVALADKTAVTRMLSAAGASIHELNCVRKHLSRIKGGRLAQAAAGARAIHSLIISDVIGDLLDTIASGPTAPDPTTFADAWQTLDKYQLLDIAPVSVRDHLDRGRHGLIADTPKKLPANVHNRIIASNAGALRAAEAKAKSLDYEVSRIGESVTGEAAQLAQRVARQIASLPPNGRCLLFGGETTVTLGEHPGRGGRNQEFVLALGCALGPAGLSGITILSAGTDGEDGPTDAAGALFDAEIWTTASTKNLDPWEYLRRHDSYPFFQATGGLLKTGLTGTNVMDIGVILMGKPGVLARS